MEPVDRERRQGTATMDLDAFRAIGDPPVDDALAHFVAGVAPERITGYVAAALHDPDGPTAEVRAFLTEPATLPAWAVPERVEAGQAVFRRWSLPMATSLFSASLPWSYGAANGVQVLALASELTGRGVRTRVAETGQMLIDVHDLTLDPEQEFAPTGQAVRTIRGVRLLHAAVRASLQQSPRWRAEWGCPVNQEDLAGTLLTFTLVVFDGLRSLGIDLTRQEREDVLHLWAVIGHLLGVDERLLCHDLDTAEALRARIVERQHRASPEGVLLMAALLEDMEASVPRLARRVPRTFVRHIGGDRVADLLEVPPAAWWRPALRLLTVVGPVVTRRRIVGRLAAGPGRVIGAAMFRRYIEYGLDGQPSRFRISDEMIARWRLRPLRRRVLDHLPRRGPSDARSTR